jgi:polyphosphate kinase
MRRIFIEQINKEIKAAKKQKPAGIIIKLNSLTDQTLINKLYTAAKAGVNVQMIVRGACCAYTQQKAFKGHMNAISIIDEYLEHGRLFVFHNEGKPRAFLSSADWMVRNLDHRVEAACPIDDPELQKELMDILNIHLAENIKGRILDNEQSNTYVQREKNQPEVRSQIAIYGYLQGKHYSD